MKINNVKSHFSELENWKCLITITKVDASNVDVSTKNLNISDTPCRKKIKIILKFTKYIMMAKKGIEKIEQKI